MAGGRKDCLPFVKKEGMVELDDKNQLRELYKEPVICMLRIKEPVDGWENVWVQMDILPLQKTL